MPPTRSEALATLEDGRRRLDELTGGLSAEDFIRPATIGGGDWSAKDLMGHIATWEQAAIDAIGSVRRGEVPAIEEYFRDDGGVDRFNAEQVPLMGSLSLAEVRERAATAHGELAAMIRKMADEEWASKLPYPTERRKTTVVLLGSITGAPKRPFGHAFAHIPDLETFVRSLK